eukprot:1928447-Prymnesium_polylepis.1
MKNSHLQLIDIMIDKNEAGRTHQGESVLLHRQSSLQAVEQVRVDKVKELRQLQKKRQGQGGEWFNQYQNYEMATKQAFEIVQRIDVEQLSAQAEGHGVERLSYRPTSFFFDGLDKLLGRTPEALTRQEMMREHLKSKDSHVPFGDPVYGTRTCSAIEWHFVVNPEPDQLKRLAKEFGDEQLLWDEQKGQPAWPQDCFSKLDRTDRRFNYRRRPLGLQTFDPVVHQINDELKRSQVDPLSPEEVIALRLRTGPMWHKYNAVLRSASNAKNSTAQQLCQGNQYTTTLYLLNSAIYKLSKVLPDIQTVWRG